MRLPLSHIKPSSVNDEIYSPTDLTELKQSIQNFGLLEPIVIDKNTKQIISGHRRYYSLKQLKIKDAEVREVEVENPTIAIIQHNQSRQKSVSDILNESRYMEIELKKMFGGQKKDNGKNGKGRFVVVQEIANKLGVGYSQLKRIKAIHNYEPSLIKKIDDGEMSVNKAYDIVKTKHLNNTRSVVSGFEKDFVKLLKKYSPKKKDIITVLQKTHPYSLENFDVNPMVTSDQATSKELKKKVAN